MLTEIADHMTLSSNTTKELNAMLKRLRYEGGKQDQVNAILDELIYRSAKAMLQSDLNGLRLQLANEIAKRAQDIKQRQRKTRPDTMI